VICKAQQRQTACSKLDCVWHTPQPVCGTCACSNEFHEDLKKLYHSAGIDGEQVVFLFSDSQVRPWLSFGGG